jgi:hypothetical protein
VRDGGRDNGWSAPIDRMVTNMQMPTLPFNIATGRAGRRCTAAGFSFGERVRMNRASVAPALLTAHNLVPLALCATLHERSLFAISSISNLIVVNVPSVANIVRLLFRRQRVAAHPWHVGRRITSGDTITTERRHATIAF